jgi:hypothetical protein
VDAVLGCAVDHGNIVREWECFGECGPADVMDRSPAEAVLAGLSCDASAITVRFHRARASGHAAATSATAEPIEPVERRMTTLRLAGSQLREGM